MTKARLRKHAQEPQRGCAMNPLERSLREQTQPGRCAEFVEIRLVSMAANELELFGGEALRERLEDELVIVEALPASHMARLDPKNDLGTVSGLDAERARKPSASRRGEQVDDPGTSYFASSRQREDR